MAVVEVYSRSKGLQYRYTVGRKVYSIGAAASAADPEPAGRLRRRPRTRWLVRGRRRRLGGTPGDPKVSDSLSKIMNFAVWTTLWPSKGDAEDPWVAPWPPKSAQEPPRSTLDTKIMPK